MFNQLYGEIESKAVEWHRSKTHNTITQAFEETYLHPVLTTLFSIDILINERYFERKTEHMVRMLLASALIDLPDQRRRGDHVPPEMSQHLLRDLHAASELMKSLQKPWGRLEDVVCFHHAFLSPNAKVNGGCRGNYVEYRTGTERVAYCGACRGEVRPPDAVPSRQRNIAQSFLNDKARMVVLRAWDCADPFAETASSTGHQSGLARTDYLQATIQASGRTYTLQRSRADGSYAEFREGEGDGSLNAILDPLRWEHRRAFQDSIRRHADTLHRARARSTASVASTLSRLYERLEDLDRTSSSYSSSPESVATNF